MNVAVQTNVNLDATRIADLLIETIRSRARPVEAPDRTSLYWRSIMSSARDLAYRLDPVLWVRDILGETPAPWQETFLRAPRGASILALTARQVGKTITA